jgi:hypothetical protein
MQLKTFLILFCIITGLFVGLNEGTTTIKSTATATKSTATTTKSSTIKNTTSIAKQKITTQAK